MPHWLSRAPSKASGNGGGQSTKRNLGRIGLLGLAQTALQYVFFYVGLAHTTGVRASIFNATGTFFSVLLAHLIYTSDRLNRRKTIGCLLGFAGVMAVNLRGGQDLDAEFTLLGDGFIVILGEEILAWRNAVALLMVCGGIWLVTTMARTPPATA